MLKALLILLLIASLGTFGAWQTYQNFLATPVSLPADGQLYHLAPGTSLREVADQLAELGVLEQPLLLVVLARLQGQSGRIQAGEYRLRPPLTPPQLLERLVAGRTVSHSLTLLEGWNFREVRAAVAANPVLTHTLAELDDAALMARLGLPGIHPEGRFYPDTYHFPRGTTDADFLRRAYRAMARVLAEEWQARAPDLPLDDPDAALTLASIIEKETGDPSERARIGGVFVRRLRQGMKLQTDPTVIYGLGEAFDGNLRRRDLRGDTPYNTYVHRGLPPTPIAMPGRAAIRAALQPQDEGYLYFVSRGDGTHQFSRTLKEHNAAVRRYQLKKSG